MNSGHIQHLDSKQLIEHRKYLEDEIVRLQLFADLKNTPEGQFILDWIKNRQSNLHEFYSSIPPADESAGVLLAGVQAAEQELRSLRDRIMDGEKYKKELEVQLRNVIYLMSRNEEKDRAKPSTRLVPENLRSEDA